MLLIVQDVPPIHVWEPFSSGEIFLFFRNFLSFYFKPITKNRILLRATKTSNYLPARKVHVNEQHFVVCAYLQKIVKKLLHLNLLLPWYNQLFSL